MKKFKNVLTLMLAAGILFSTVGPTYAASNQIVSTNKVTIDEVKDYAIKNNKVMPAHLYKEFKAQQSSAKTQKELTMLSETYGQYIISESELRGIPTTSSIARLGESRIEDEYIYSHEIRYDTIEQNNLSKFMELSLNISSAFLTTGRSILVAILGSIPTTDAVDYNNFISYTEHDEMSTMRLAQIYVPNNIFYSDGWVNYAQSNLIETEATVTTKYGYKGKVTTERTSTQLVDRLQGRNFDNKTLLRNQAESLYKKDVDKYGNANNVIGPQYLDPTKAKETFKFKLDF